MIIWALSTVGITLIVVESPLFSWFRKYIGKPFSCYQCFGFWAGIVCWLMLMDYIPGKDTVHWFYPLWLDIFNRILFVGFAGSFLAVISVTILERLGKYEQKNL